MRYICIYYIYICGHIQTTQFVYLGVLVDASADIMPDSKGQVRFAWWAYFNRFKREFYDMEAAPFALKVRKLKAEVIRDPVVRVCNVDPRQGAFR